MKRKINPKTPTTNNQVPKSMTVGDGLVFALMNKKGITLVALVVTIIILIILAGVTLNIVLDHNGIISKSHQGVSDYKNAQESEKEQIADAEEYINRWSGGTGEVTSTPTPLLPAPNIPVPNGFVISGINEERKIDDGVVIYEIPEEKRNEAELWKKTKSVVIDEDAGTTITVPEVQTEYNQYVWIPVNDIDSMVMCESNTGTSICDLELDGEILKCNTHPETATNLVGRLYLRYSAIETEDETTSQIFDFTRKDQTYSSYPKEPALVTEKDKNDSKIGNYILTNYMEMAGIEDGKTSSLKSQMESDFIAMATSVKKNGGFYISRYEIGTNGESKRGQTVLTSYNQENGRYLRWYGLYKACRDVTKKSQMIFGCQYDQLIKFIGREAMISHKKEELMATEALAGVNEKDKMKNIYDLESNHSELTAEANSVAARSDRGMSWDNVEIDVTKTLPAANRSPSDPTSNSWSESTRSIIYL